MTSYSMSRLTRVFTTPRTGFIRPYSTPRSSLLRQTRTFASTTSQFAQDNHPQKEAQKDREKMDTQPNEYSKSGTDAEVASENKDAAFDGNTPKPEDAKDEAAKGSGGNPLEASPADPKLSQTTEEVEGGSKKKISEGGGGRQGGGEGRERQSI